ncbi:hypothetical protein D3C85_1486550 [compost metagenome]
MGGTAAVPYVTSNRGQGIVALLPGQEVDTTAQHGGPTCFQGPPGAHASCGVFSGQGEDERLPVHEQSVLLECKVRYIIVDISTIILHAQGVRG